MSLMKASLVFAALCLATPYAIAGTGDEARVAAAVWPTKGWEVSTPEAEGMDSAALARLVDAVGARRHDSLLVARHGRIVAEAYYAPFQTGVRHDLRSVTKSVVGTLIGVELQDGLMDGVDRKVVDLFSDRPLANIDDNKRAMTVENLLDMTSGLAWREGAYTPDESIMQMYHAKDRTQFVLDQPMATKPGSWFVYNGGAPYVLSALITRRTGMSALKFAKDRLFEPLGITSFRWGPTDAQGVTDGESGLFLEPRDMAKIGYLYLRGGMWEGKRIIPSSFIDRVRQGPVEANSYFHYGNLWWSRPERRAFMARGRHSQLILVLPDVDVVAVMTGTMWDDEHYPMGRLIDAIMLAVKSDAPLPPDEAGQSQLAASLANAATEPPGLIGEPPELAKTISGKSYAFSDNVLHMRSLSLNLVEPDPSWEATLDPQEPGEPPRRLTGAIGLDGKFRKTQTSFGIEAAKGRWISDETFEVERRILGHGETQLWRLRFDGKAVDIHYENTDGFKTELDGEQRD